MSLPSEIDVGDYFTSYTILELILKVLIKSL